MAPLNNLVGLFFILRVWNGINIVYPRENAVILRPQKTIEDGNVVQVKVSLDEIFSAVSIDVVVQCGEYYRLINLTTSIGVVGDRAILSPRVNDNKVVYVERLRPKTNIIRREVCDIGKDIWIKNNIVVKVIEVFNGVDVLCAEQGIEHNMIPGVVDAQG